MEIEAVQTFQPLLNHFEVQYRGDYNADALEVLGNHIVEYAANQRYKKVLVDLTAAQGKLSMMGRYHLVSRMKDSWPKDLRTAVLVRPDQTLKAAGFIWQRLSNYAGFATGIYFQKCEALEWLAGTHAAVKSA